MKNLNKRRFSNVPNVPRGSVLQKRTSMMQPIKRSSQKLRDHSPDGMANPLGKINKLKKPQQQNAMISYPGIRYSPPSNTPFEPHASSPVQAKKQTSCHKIVVATRDKFMREITGKIRKLAENAHKNRDERIALIEQWTAEWHKDVNQVRNLY